MGKQAERQACGSEFDNSGAVAKKTRSMSGIGVEQGPQLLVVTAEECRAGADDTGGTHDAAIKQVAKFHHGDRFVDAGGGKKIRSLRTKNLLRGRQDASGVLTTTGDIKQAEQDPFGAYTNGIIEASGDAFPVEQCGHSAAPVLGAPGRTGPL